MNSRKKIFSTVTMMLLTLILFVISFEACGDREEFGIGPVKDELKLEPVKR